MEFYNVRFEIYQNDKLIQKQIIEAPKEVISMQFINYVRQIRNSSEKFNIKLIMPELIWIPWDNKHEIQEKCIEIKNYV